MIVLPGWVRRAVYSFMTDEEAGGWDLRTGISDRYGGIVQLQMQARAESGPLLALERVYSQYSLRLGRRWVESSVEQAVVEFRRGLEAQRRRERQ